MNDTGWVLVGAVGGVVLAAGGMYAAYKLWIYRSL